jgi:hypothetical protein
MLLGMLAGFVSVDFASEDTLTSAVLGSLRYLPASVTFEWLTHARDLSGQSVAPLAHPDASLDACMSLWPSFDDVLRGAGCVIPDATIDVDKRLIVLEVKLASGKSQGLYTDEQGIHRVSDQLAREWVGAYHQRRHVDASLPPPEIIFVTAHALAPAADLEESQEALHDAGHTVRVYWLSWGALARTLRIHRPKLTREQATLVDDVLHYLSRALPAHILPFAGWEDIEPAAEDAACVWKYRREAP